MEDIKLNKDIQSLRFDSKDNGKEIKEEYKMEEVALNDAIASLNFDSRNKSKVESCDNKITEAKKDTIYVFEEETPKEYLSHFGIKIGSAVEKAITSTEDVDAILDACYIYGTKRITVKLLNDAKEYIKKYFDGTLDEDEEYIDLSESFTGEFSHYNLRDLKDGSIDLDDVDIVHVTGLKDDEEAYYDAYYDGSNAEENYEYRRYDLRHKDESLGEDEDAKETLKEGYASHEYCVMKDGNNIEVFSDEAEAVKFAEENDADKVLEVHYSEEDEYGDRTEMGFDCVWEKEDLTESKEDEAKEEVKDEAKAEAVTVELAKDVCNKLFQLIDSLTTDENKDEIAAKVNEIIESHKDVSDEAWDELGVTIDNEAKADEIDVAEDDDTDLPLDFDDDAVADDEDVSMLDLDDLDADLEDDVDEGTEDLLDWNLDEEE